MTEWTDTGQDMSPEERRGWGLPKTYLVCESESQDFMDKDIVLLQEFAAQLRTDTSLTEARKAAAWRGFLLERGGYDA